MPNIFLKFLRSNCEILSLVGFRNAEFRTMLSIILT